MKEQFLVSLTHTRETQIVDTQARFEQLRVEFAVVSEQRSHRLAEFTAVKGECETAQAEAHNQLTAASVKRQHAQARVKRAEGKKLDAEIQVHRVLDDLKIHLSTIKEELRRAIEDAHAAQAALIREEADEKAMQEARALAQELLRVEKQKQGKAPGNTKASTLIGELSGAKQPAAGMPVRRRAAATQKVKVAAGAPVVTPEFPDG
jgi:chromosome segregation ATPase